MYQDLSSKRCKFLEFVQACVCTPNIPVILCLMWSAVKVILHSYSQALLYARHAQAMWFFFYAFPNKTHQS